MTSGKLFGFCAACCLLLSSVGRAQQLDQEFTPAHGTYNLGANVNEGRKFVGQVFTAGVAGQLTRVTTSLHRFGTAQSDFEFTIRATANGIPVGAPLATELVPYTAVPSGGLLAAHITFDPAPLVVPGVQYAVVVQSPFVPPGAGQATAIWAGSTTPGYVGGTPIVSDDNLTWIAPSDYDLFFQTYVTVPEPSAALALLAPAALAGLRRRRRR